MQQAQFHPTRWSLIVRAGEHIEPSSSQALAELYRIYWYPLYAYARRRGVAPEAAADLIQGFFVELLEGALLRTADPAKGRFRSYLLGALKHFMSGQRDRARAQKRGGGIAPVSIDDAEARYGLEPADELTPERVYDRRWAMTLLERAMHQLAEEHERSGSGRQFETLKNLLAGPLPDRSYAEVGVELGMSEGAVKVAVHRLRQRYREVLRAHIGETVTCEGDIEDEIRHLHEALAGGA
jgi:RNA polymerase sigma factor (sigma-70 family)